VERESVKRGFPHPFFDNVKIYIYEDEFSFGCYEKIGFANNTNKKLNNKNIVIRNIFK